MDGRRKRSRGRSAKHEGVVFQRRVLPSGSISWRARYRDPDTQKIVWETVPAHLSTDEQRFAWAVRKRGVLADRVEDLDKGAPTKKNLTIEETLERYFETEAVTLREGTKRVYRAAADRMVAWSKERGIASADDLRAENLAELRAYLVNLPRRGAVKKGKRGARVEVAGRRAPETINIDLRAIRRILDRLRRLGLLPMITLDAISNLELLSLPRPVVRYLKPADLKRLVGAARRHDEDVFDLTRDEKARGATVGETPRYSPILPYLATVLLSGMRADEARSLLWARVDLDDAPAGSITLEPDDTKTKHGRKVDLLVSPLLHDLLRELRLRAPGAKYVFGEPDDESEDAIFYATRRRLAKKFGAPRFTWKQLRATCGTYLANAPGIFGAASVWRESVQLGHSVMVAEKHYLGVVSLPKEATTLEAAMGIEDALRSALGLRVEAKAEKGAKMSG